MTTPAGWYPDPEGTGGQRYFDGRSWTDHRSPPAPAAAYEAPALDALQAAPQKSGPNGKVIAGIVAAVAVLVVVGVTAVYLTMKTDVGDATVTHKPSDASAQTPSVGSDPETGSEAGVEAPTLENQASSVGQAVRDGNFEFVVTGVDRAAVVADPEFPDLQKAAAGEFVMVNMKVTNVGAEPADVLRVVQHALRRDHRVHVRRRSLDLSRQHPGRSQPRRFDRDRGGFRRARRHRPRVHRAARRAVLGGRSRRAVERFGDLNGGNVPSLRPTSMTARGQAPLAQSVERFHGKEKVNGSIPLGGSVAAG